MEHHRALLRLLQAHVPADRMMADVLTDDFRTGFVDGFVWQGRGGLEDFLRSRSEFFDEEHAVEQVSAPVSLDGDRVGVHIRLSFFLRSRKGAAARSEEFSGKAFHWWEFAPDAAPARWRVAARMVVGFAELNDNASSLFAAPESGLRT